MKKLLLIILFLPLLTFAQEYSEVVEISGKNADQLYTKANEWFALTFKSSKDVIQLNDPIEKKIIGKGIKPIHYPVGKYDVTMNISFTLFVQFKDGKFKYDIQSTEIYPIIGNESYTYELFKAVATEEGLLEYYKQKGIKPWVIGKAQIQTTLEGNKAAIMEIEKQMHSIIEDLTLSLKKEESKDNW